MRLRGLVDEVEDRAGAPVEHDPVGRRVEHQLARLHLERDLRGAELPQSGRRADEQVPRVVGQIAAADLPRVAEHGVRVGVRRVVVVEGAAEIVRRVVRVKVVRRSEDRVGGIVDVATEAVRAPGRRHELHRALRPGDARLAQPAERGLDHVHGREHVPRHPEAALGPPVGLLELRRRTRGTRAEGRERPRRGQPHELGAGKHVVPHLRGKAGRQRRDRRRGEAQLRPLEVEHRAREVARHGAPTVPAGGRCADGRVRAHELGARRRGRRGNERERDQGGDGGAHCAEG